MTPSSFVPSEVEARGTEAEERPSAEFIQSAAAGGVEGLGTNEVCVKPIETNSIRVNGEHRRAPKGITVAELALELGLEPTRVAVERNLEIVPRSTLAQVKVEDGDDYEIVTFVGGG